MHPHTSRLCLAVVNLVLACVVVNPSIAQDEDDFAHVWFVDGSFATNGNGETWLTAFNNLQSAIAAARESDQQSDLIKVAQGMYIPTEMQQPGDPRSATFYIAAPDFTDTARVWIVGGYRGCPGGSCGPPDPNDRDIVEFVTILSGDIPNPPIPCGSGGSCFVPSKSPGCDDYYCCQEICVIDPPCCQVAWDEQCVQQAYDSCPGHTYHVVTFEGEDVTLTTRLDGFTITNGHANGGGIDDFGGGVLFNEASPMVVQCTFVGDFFVGNKAVAGAGLAVVGDIAAKPWIINCTFFGHPATGTLGGGAAYIDQQLGETHGPHFVNCLFTDNHANSGAGGAIAGNNKSNIARIDTCTFYDCTALTDGGAVNDVYTVVNSIIWGAITPLPAIDEVENMTYSDAQGVPPVGSNQDVDPEYALPGGFWLNLISPVLNDGNDAALPDDLADLDEDEDLLEPTPLDILLNRRISRNDVHPCDPGTVDMGAYENGDCDADGVRDENEVDSNGDRIPDDCQYCNANAIFDPTELAQCGGQPACSDCNGNLVLDECDIAGGCSTDKNMNGIPDECECEREKLDVVFIVDTSIDSMGEELADVCTMATEVVSSLCDVPNCMDVKAYYMGITNTPTCAFDSACSEELVDNVVHWLGTNQGDSACASTLNEEDWAPATRLVAARAPWRFQATRVIIPISDEGPCHGNPCVNPGSDQLASDHAATISNSKNVFVYPVTGRNIAPGEATCVRSLAASLASQTAGQAFDHDADGGYTAIDDLLVVALLGLTDKCTGGDLCLADFGGDCVVGINDLLLLLATWTSGQPCSDCSVCQADLDGDGGVGITDLLQLLASWGPCPPGCMGGVAGGPKGPQAPPLDVPLNMLGYDNLSHLVVSLSGANNDEAYGTAILLLFALTGGEE